MHIFRGIRMVMVRMMMRATCHCEVRATCFPEGGVPTRPISISIVWRKYEQWDNDEGFQTMGSHCESPTVLVGNCHWWGDVRRVLISGDETRATMHEPHTETYPRLSTGPPRFTNHTTCPVFILLLTYPLLSIGQSRRPPFTGFRGLEELLLFTYSTPNSCIFSDLAFLLGRVEKVARSFMIVSPR